MRAACSIDGCNKPSRSRGWCGMHYMRWHTTGDPLATLRVGRPAKPELERLADKFTVGDGCWEWTAARSASGYGQFTIASGKARRAHRVVYELLAGPIPAGLELDHLCRNRACVRPDHLEPVTGRENKLRGDTVNARNAAKTECVHGHPFEGENLYVTIAGHRGCRACDREKRQRYEARRAQQRAPF